MGADLSAGMLRHGRRIRLGKDCFGLDESQVRLHTAIALHTVLVMAALAI